MRIFAIISTVPAARDGEAGVNAVNIVCHHIISEIASMGHHVRLQIIFNEFRWPPRPLNERETEGLEEIGKIRKVSVEPVVFAEQYMPWYHKFHDIPGKSWAATTFARKLARTVLPNGSGIARFYPAIRIGGIIEKRVAAFNSDALLTIWSPEGVAAIHGIRNIPKIIYQGDIDHVPGEVRLAEPHLFYGDRSEKELSDARERQRCFKQAHLKLMKNADLIANVTMCNAQYYKAHNHPRSVYIRNTWIDPGNRLAQKNMASGTQRLARKHRKIKIIGHVGSLDRTGTTYGLQCLASLMPALEKELKDVDYDIHVIGGGTPAPGVSNMLRHPRIVMRGFVKDLDHELNTSDIMLLLNNSGPYQAAFTRHLVAWSSGLCLVVHNNSRNAIPEIVHGENSLTGSTPDELAKSVKLALTPECNRSIREGGRKLFLDLFTPKRIARSIIQYIEERK